MKSEDVINAVGGRKNMLGYAFIGCSTFLVNAMLINGNKPDYVGMSTVIGAVALGLGSIVWGNVKEHQAKSPVSNTNVTNTIPTAEGPMP